MCFQRFCRSPNCLPSVDRLCHTSEDKSSKEYDNREDAGLARNTDKALTLDSRQSNVALPESRHLPPRKSLASFAIDARIVKPSHPGHSEAVPPVNSSLKGGLSKLAIRAKASWDQKEPSVHGEPQNSKKITLAMQNSTHDLSTSSTTPDIYSSDVTSQSGKPLSKLQQRIMEVSKPAPTEYQSPKAAISHPRRVSETELPESALFASTPIAAAIPSGFASALLPYQPISLPSSSQSKDRLPYTASSSFMVDASERPSPNDLAPRTRTKPTFQLASFQH